jgi:hypothetical protein
MLCTVQRDARGVMQAYCYRPTPSHGVPKIAQEDSTQAQRAEDPDREVATAFLYFSIFRWRSRGLEQGNKEAELNKEERFFFSGFWEWWGKAIYPYAVCLIFSLSFAVYTFLKEKDQPSDSINRDIRNVTYFCCSQYPLRSS